MRKLTVATVLMLAQSAIAQSGWTLVEQKDAMTDHVQRAAVVVNAEGHTFAVHARSDGAVWANFSLAERYAQQIGSYRGIMYRVDSLPARDLEPDRRLQELAPSIAKRYIRTPNWVNFRLWDGRQGSDGEAAIKELAGGQRLLVRFPLSTGGHRDTEFTLDGARAAMEGAAVAPALAVQPANAASMPAPDLRR